MQLPSLKVPDPALTGMRTVIRRAPYDEGRESREELFQPPDSRSILVTKEQEVNSVS